MTEFLFQAARYRKPGTPRVRLSSGGQRALATTQTYLRAHPDAASIACPCGRAEDVSLSQTDRHGLPYPLALCMHCGLVRMDPQPDDETLAWFYTNVYRDIYDPEVRDGDAFFRGKLWKGALVERALQRSGVSIASGPVLDLGCGGGWTLATFAQRGVACVGYDFDQRLMALGNERGLDLRLGGTAEAIASGVKAALVICAHVVEHVRDPVAHLAGLIPLIAPEGSLYLEVPNLQRIGARLRGDSLVYWQRAHLWEFQRAHLIAFAADAGLETFWSDQDDDNIYLLCRVGKRVAPSWPSLGSEVSASLVAFEKQRRRPTSRIVSLLLRTRVARAGSTLRSRLGHLAPPRTMPRRLSGTAQALRTTLTR